MEHILSLPVSGIILTILCYALGVKVRTVIRSPLVNPLLIADGLLILVLNVSPLTSAQYLSGGNLISIFIVPATTILAIRIFRQRALLRANALPILAGCLAGSFVSIGCIMGLCKLLGIDRTITASLLPKSVTTAIALELSEKHSGLGGLTVSAVIITGVISATFSPIFIRVFKLKDPIAAGLAIGASGHAIGTATALELGETEGAASGVALGLMGIITSIIFVFLF